MPLNKKLYAMTARILYRSVSLDVTRTKTILDGLPVGKHVPPLWAKNKTPPKNRKWELLKLVKVLDTPAHYHGGHPAARASDAGKLEYSFPNVKEVRLHSTICYSGFTDGCSLVNDRGIRPATVHLKVDGLQVLEHVDEWDMLDGAELVVHCSHHEAHPVRDAPVRSSRKTSLLIYPESLGDSVFSSTLATGELATRHRGAWSKIVDFCSEIRTPLSVVGLERVPWPRSRARREEAEAEEAPEVWRQSEAFQFMQKRYMRTGDLLFEGLLRTEVEGLPDKKEWTRKLQRRFDKIEYLSYEQYLEGHQDLELLPVKQMRKWIEDIPVRFSQMAAPALQEVDSSESIRRRTGQTRKILDRRTASRTGGGAHRKETDGQRLRGRGG
jgi:hypothetical protein